MISLADVKAHLGVTGTDQDEYLQSLIDRAREYFSMIGVTIDPEPSPVGEAIILMVGQLYAMPRGISQREEEIPGVRRIVSADPRATFEVTTATIERLIAPYRSISL